MLLIYGLDILASVCPKFMIRYLKILVVVVGFVLVIISMIFHRDNYKIVNIFNYIAVVPVSCFYRVIGEMPWG